MQADSYWARFSATVHYRLVQDIINNFTALVSATPAFCFPHLEQTNSEAESRRDTIEKSRGG
jgi:hypothetical protein